MDEIGEEITKDILERLENDHKLTFKGKQLERVAQVAEKRLIAYVRDRPSKNLWRNRRFRDFILDMVLPEIANEFKKGPTSPTPDELQSRSEAVMKRPDVQKLCGQMLKAIDPEKGAVLTPVCDL